MVVQLKRGVRGVSSWDSRRGAVKSVVLTLTRERRGGGGGVQVAGWATEGWGSPSSSPPVSDLNPPEY